MKNLDTAFVRGMLDKALDKPNEEKFNPYPVESDAYNAWWDGYIAYQNPQDPRRTIKCT